MLIRQFDGSLTTLAGRQLLLIGARIPTLLPSRFFALLHILSPLILPTFALLYFVIISKSGNHILASSAKRSPATAANLHLDALQPALGRSLHQKRW
jgi:hypothetical protein